MFYPVKLWELFLRNILVINFYLFLKKTFINNQFVIILEKKRGKMDKFPKYFLSGVFLLVMLLSMWFVFADSYDVAPSTAEAGETVSLLVFNVTNATEGAINNNLTTITLSIIGTTGNFANITSVNISNGTNDYSNDSITGSVVTIDASNAQIDADTNLTINVTLSSSATWNITFGINVTGIGAEANVTATSTPFNSSLVTVDESTAPTATAICDPNVLYVGTSFPCSCSGTDDGATASGVSTETGSSTSSDGTSTPTSTGTFTYTCTVTDNAGNSVSDTATYTVGRTPSSSGTTTPPLPKKIHSWTKITPGVVTIMKDFDSEIGIRQIQIDVNNPAQNVKITVTKHDGKPAEVTVEKSGKVYQYLQIGAENFDNTLDKATVEFRVGRTWATSVELGKNDIAVFRYNEAVSRWDELTTTSTGEDATYYYYEVELDEFSYFAISEKSVVSEEELILGVEKSKLWLWILIAVVIIAIVFWRMKAKKE